MDQHKDSIAVAIAPANGQPFRYYGAIANTPEAVKTLVRKLFPEGGWSHSKCLSIEPTNSVNLINAETLWVISETLRGCT